VLAGVVSTPLSGAEVAETTYTAFTSKKKELQVTARLIVRRVRALNARAAEGQGELSPVSRYHATAEGISPFTCPSTGTASTSGAACGQPRAVRPPQRRDQPRQAPPARRKAQCPPPPAPEPRTSRRRRARRGTHVRIHLRNRNPS
jgi:hypothetical protein